MIFEVANFWKNSGGYIKLKYGNFFCETNLKSIFYFIFIYSFSKLNIFGPKMYKKIIKFCFKIELIFEEANFWKNSGGYIIKCDSIIIKTICFNSFSFIKNCDIYRYNHQLFYLKWKNIFNYNFFFFFFFFFKIAFFIKVGKKIFNNILQNQYHPKFELASFWKILHHNC